MGDSIRKGFGSKDSLQRADHLCDLYYSVRHPTAPKRIQVVASGCKDTVENLQKKLEKEAQQRLMMENKESDSQIVKFLAMGGRIIFMTFVFPPYVVLYVMPKFVLGEALPKLFVLLLKPFTFLRHTVMESLSRLHANFMALIKPRKIDEKKITLLKKISTSLASLRDRSRAVVLAPFHFVRDAYLSALDFIRQAARRQIDRVKAAIKSTVSRTKNRVLNQFERLADGLHRVFILPVADRIAPKAARLKAFFSKNQQTVSQFLQKVKGEVSAFLRDPKLWLSKKRDFVTKRILSVANEISTSAVDWLRHQKNEISAVLRTVRGNVYDLCADRLQLAKQQIQDWGQAGLQTIKQTFNIVAVAVAQTSQQVMRVVAKKIDGWWSQGKEQSRQKYKALKGALEPVLIKARDSLRLGVQRGVSELRKFLFDLFEKALNYLMLVPAFLWKYAVQKSLVVQSKVKKIAYALRVGKIWAKAVCRYGMILVREAAHEVFSSLTLWLQRF